METDNKKVNRFKALPAFVQDSLYEEYTLDAITDIRKNYLEGDLEKNEALKDIIALTVLKDSNIEQLYSTVEEKLKLNKTKAKEVTLIVLCRILHPIKDFFPGIEDQILKLGGEIPKESPKKSSDQLARRDEEMEELREIQEREGFEIMKDTIVNLPISDLAREYPQVEMQQIGNQESITIKGADVPMKPIIKYWIKDYLEKMGYNMHSNLERVQYVYHDKNTKNMNEEERHQLSLVFKSLDEGMSLPYSTKRGKIDFSKVEEE